MVNYLKPYSLRKRVTKLTDYAQWSMREALVEGLVVGVHLIKKHKPKDTRSVMRFANRGPFSVMWEITVGLDIPNHKYLSIKDNS